MKTCKKCNQLKDESEFHRSGVHKSGLNPACRECIKLYGLSLSRKQRDIPNEKLCSDCKQKRPSSDFHKRGRNRDGLRSQCRFCTRKQECYYRSKNPDNEFYRKIWYKYKLTKDGFDKMIQEQDSRCYICGLDTVLVVDHNHTTGKIRKLLCHKCNAGVGMFSENPDVMRKAALYVEKYNVT